jgi:hypothetical protein
MSVESVDLQDIESASSAGAEAPSTDYDYDEPSFAVCSAVWAGLVIGPFAWLLQQQLLSAGAFAACAASTQRNVISAGIACAVMASIGAGLSWWGRERLPRGEAPDDVGSRRFIADMSILLAGFSIAVIAVGSWVRLELECG